MKKFFQTLFSAVNDKNHKIITVLGFKLKFRNKNTVKIDDSSLQKIKLLFANSLVKVDCETINNFENSLLKCLNKFFDYKKEPAKKRNIDIYTDITVLKEPVEISVCPFCKSTKFYPIREFQLKTLIEKYIDIYKIDPIGSCYKGETLYKYHCSECGLEFYNYYIPDTSLFYEKLLESGNYKYPKYKWEYSKAVDVIQEYNCKRVLDIGCGYGYFLEKIQNIVGYTLGIEFNVNALEECKSKNLNVTSAKLSEINEKFDCICLFQVLEHIKEPKIFLEQVVDLLYDGGVLIIGTPNPEGLWIQSNPDILNLPPHHCLDITKIFYENIPKYLNLVIEKYFQDKPEFSLYQRYYFPTKVSKEILSDSNANIYGYFLQEKENLLGHRHICVYRKWSNKNNEVIFV